MGSGMKNIPTAKRNWKNFLLNGKEEVWCLTREFFVLFGFVNAKGPCGALFILSLN
jgi:hypothetical protein